MRIRKRLEALEQLLRMDTCDVCGSGDYAIAFWPNGADTELCVNMHGEPFQENCPGCHRSFLKSGAPLKVFVGIDPNLV